MSDTLNEDAQKKNTDCVYFLASPLTCKKGNVCEFRHSENARNNPRDCWYWLSGACLNANCAFRHPPLDALPEGEQVAVGKSRVPCYYFLQGYCVKGDKCIFMHGLPTASSGAEKTLTSSIAKTCGNNVLDNQNSANKENGLVASKACLEYNEAPLAQKSNEAQEPDVTMTDRLPEGSDSSAAVRSRPPQSSEISKQDSAINRTLHPQVHASDNEFLNHEAQTEDEPLCDFQPREDGLGQDPYGEDCAHNGTESEELWEESSFDVLVDDGGTDQLIYADELDYLNQYDAIVDHLTAGHIQAGVRGADGFVDFEYDETGVYSQYYDGEYELATYDAYEQHLLYEHLSSFDPEDGLPPVVPLNGRQANHMHSRDRRDGSFNGKVRPANVGSNDLRNHISKRRRAEKNQEDYYQRRHQASNGSQHNRRHQEGHSNQHDRLSRRHISPQTGSRLNRQYDSRGDLSGGRQFHGCLVDPLGMKRAYRDAGSGHEELSIEQTSGKKFRGVNEIFKAKGKPERGRVAVYEVDNALRSRRRPAAYGADDAFLCRGRQHSKKAEGHKEESSFTGPKSLAQIKAEKMKVTGGGCLSHQPESRGELRSGRPKQEVYVVQGCLSEAPLREPGKASVLKEFDFEGPKPLSVILKHKRRENGNDDEAQELRHEKSDREEGNGATGEPRPSSSAFAGARRSSKRATYYPADLSTVAEDIRGSISGAELAEHGVRANGERGLHWQQEAASFPISFAGNELELGDLHANRQDKRVEPAPETKHGLEMGDSLMEDGEYEDEDEDDFAKKLGGFFS